MDFACSNSNKFSFCLFFLSFFLHYFSSHIVLFCVFGYKIRTCI